MSKSLTVLLLFALLVPFVIAGDRDETEDYGADVSFPIHHHLHKNGVLGDRQKVYEHFMDGCRKFNKRSPRRCDAGEEDRLAMSVRQPQSMVNFTSTGFMKIRAPERVRNLLTDYWEKNKNRKTLENWPAGNVYTNHWEAPTYMVSVEDTGLRGGGSRLKQDVWDAAQSTIEHWTGMELRPTSMYGIRVYTEGAILNPHVDRLPLVSSAIVNVAQDVDEDWVLEVYDRQGKAVNVTMEPGDMVLYESHSLIHGRPFPLKGRFFANIFIHFEPTGRPLYHRDDDRLEDHYDFLPPYIVPGSLEADHWSALNRNGWKMPTPASPRDGRPIGHVAAATGDLHAIKRLAKENRHALKVKDRNGWQPIHEAARAGEQEIIKVLLDSGVDINARTHGGKGGSPLNVAINTLSKDHPVSRFLVDSGAKNIEPEL